MRSDRYQGFLFNSADLSEDVDIDLETRKEILHLVASMNGYTHWQVLGLPWNASAEQVRDAYRDRAKRFHPDRFPGMRLGSYRGRLERIFRRLTEARDGLADEAARAAYAQRTAPPEEVARATARQIENDARARERRERLVRHHPVVARVGRAREFLERGRKAMEQERWADAARDFMTAQAMDSGVAEARELADQARRKATAAKALDLWERARTAELQHDLDRAQVLAEAAAEADPGEPRWGMYVARLALARGARDTARARAESVVRAAPSLAAGHELLGEILAAQGDKAGARRALERALELDAGLEGARERLRKLRWSFLG